MTSTHWLNYSLAVHAKEDKHQKLLVFSLSLFPFLSLSLFFSVSHSKAGKASLPLHIPTFFNKKPFLLANISSSGFTWINCAVLFYSFHSHFTPAHNSFTSSFIRTKGNERERQSCHFRHSDVCVSSACVCECVKWS